MLTVKALRCVQLRNAAEGSAERQDPYVTLTLEERPDMHSRTDVCYSGGINPQWTSGGNWMRLPVPKPNMTCLVQVWDKHSQDADELIGAGKIRLSRFEEDGAEEEPMAVKLTWQNGIPAGQFHCVFSYDPPEGNVSAKQIHYEEEPVVKTDTSSYTGLRAARPVGQPESTSASAKQDDFLPWLKLKVRHRSGKVKEFLVSRTRAGIDKSRGYVREKAPHLRTAAEGRWNWFITRSIIEQAIVIAALILIAVLPYPRELVFSAFSAANDAFMAARFWAFYYTHMAFDLTSERLGSAFAFAGGILWKTATLAWDSFWYAGLYAVLPVALVLGLPRLLGWAATKIGVWALGGKAIVSLGTVTVVPWMTDFRRLKFRVIVVDFLIGNPRDRGYTPRFVSFNRFEVVGSISLSDIFRTMILNYRDVPLKDVHDYKMLASLRLDHLEIDGLAINLEVNDRNKLNLLDFVSEYDRAAVDRALRKKDINPRAFRFPNCLEVQVLGARNLSSEDRSGQSDPYYVVRVRKQTVVSETVVKTLNPAFPPRVEQFYVDDPSAVVSVVLQDQDVARRSDYLGQWNTTAKYLLIDPKKNKYNEWERLSDEDRRQGWVGFWAPLVDKHFREEGQHGDIHLRLRWVYNPALPDVRPNERRESQTPMQQLNTLRHEIRQRLGDLRHIMDILKHIPILLDYEGLFVLNDTKISVHDLLFGRKREADNIVRKVVVKHREETIKRQTEQMQEFPRSLDVKETASALDRDKLYGQPEEKQEPKTDGIAEVVITSADPNQPRLARNLDLEVNTRTGEPILSEDMRATTTTGGSSTTTQQQQPQQQEQRAMATLTKENKTVEFDASKNIITSTGIQPTFVPNREKYEEEKECDTDVVGKEERERMERDQAREQEKSRSQNTANTAGVNSTATQSTVQSAPEPVQTTGLKQALREDLGGDKLMAVFPEKLVSSALGGTDQGYVRGPLVGTQEDLGRQDDLYLGSEEDDEAAEMRNEDRYNDDDREYDQDGREFIKIRPIVFRKQFMARHGDPGLNLYKFLERLVRGLIPKLASDTRLRRAFEGTAIRSLFKGELREGGITEVPSTATGTQPSSEPGVHGAAHKVGDGIKHAAQAVKDQAKLVQKKMFGEGQDEQVRQQQEGGERGQVHHEALTGSKVTTAVPAAATMRSEKGDYYQGGSSESVSSSPKAVSNTRPVHGQDEDFIRSDLVIAGGLEAMWQGRHRLTTMFKRWKPWHVEIKGDAIYYHKNPSLGAFSSGAGTAAEHTWYLLDLTYLQDLYLTDSNRAQNNEMVLRFTEDDHTLHLRLPSRTTTPTLQDWFEAFRKVQSAQQGRSRQTEEESASPVVPSTQAWPGEDKTPQPRARGSSLHKTALAQPTKDVNLPAEEPSGLEEKSTSRLEEKTGSPYPGGKVFTTVETTAKDLNTGNEASAVSTGISQSEVMQS